MPSTARCWTQPPAALAATASLVVALFVFGHEGKRPSMAQLGDAFRNTGSAAVSIIYISAAAGIVIGALNDAGVLFILTEAIIGIGSDNLPLLLVLAAVLCIILGMGMPTVGVYALLSTLVAAPLVQLGIERLSAHMFVLYFGMMSMITPPVAVAVFTAAAVAKTDAMRTGWEAVKLAWAAYAIPFVFVANPALIMNGSALEVAVAVSRASIGVWLVSACIIGYLSHRLFALPRLGYFILGALLLVPGAHLPGGFIVGGGLTLLAGLALLAYEFTLPRRQEGSMHG